MDQLKHISSRCVTICKVLIIDFLPVILRYLVQFYEVLLSSKMLRRLVREIYLLLSNLWHFQLRDLFIVSFFAEPACGGESLPTRTVLVVVVAVTASVRKRYPFYIGCFSKSP